MHKGPFVGLRVLDLARTLAASYAATILANLGAEVIAVEQPGSISKAAPLPGRMAGGVNAAYNYFVYNKKCIALNLRKEQGRDIFYRLVGKSDVLIENYRPQVSQALGIEYEALRKINNRIISCSITGYGDSGPYRNRLVWDPTGQAVSGIMSLTGGTDGEPCVVGTFIVDVGTGMNAALGIMAALYHRDRSGEGQRVEICLLETGVSFLSWFPTYYSAGGKIPRPEGSSLPLNGQNGVFKTKSGNVHISSLHQNHWENLCRTIGHSDLIADHRFIDDRSRIANRIELRNIIQGTILTRTAEEWINLLSKAGVPVAPVNDIPSLFTDPQVQHMDLFKDIMSVEGKPIKISRLPFRMSEFRDQEYGPAPRVGEHTESVLSELAGVTPQEMKMLCQEEVIGIPSADKATP